MEDIINSLTPSDREHFSKFLDEMQLKDTMGVYNRLVFRCFSDCVTTFRGKTLDDKERKCVDNCASKWLAHSKRVGQRFSEAQFQHQQAAAAATAKQ